MKFLILLFIISPLFGQTFQANITVSTSHWVQTDNATLRAQDRKNKPWQYTLSTFYGSYIYPNFNLQDADAMREQYILPSHEVCGTVTAYEEAPGVIHFEAIIRYDDKDGSKWETKEAAEADVVNRCNPTLTWSTNCFVTTPAHDVTH